MFTKAFIGVSIASGWGLWGYLLYLLTIWMNDRSATDRNPPLIVGMFALFVVSCVAVGIVSLVFASIRGLINSVGGD